METPELIYAAQHGNLQAFNRLIADYGDLIYRLLSRAALPDLDAEPLTQAAIQNIYRKLPGYRDGDFRLWIFKHLVNFCRSRIRRNHSHPKKLQETSTEEQILQRCLSELPVEERLVVILVDMEKLSYGETAAVLGIPVKAVQSRLARARWLVMTNSSSPVLVSG
jgi:RNA polymerase sigma factor (sigma-70 family)